MSFELMGADGDGDLSAVVWGVASARTPSFVSQQFQPDQSTTMLAPPSSFTRYMFQKSGSGPTIDTASVTSTSDGSISGLASSSCPYFVPQRSHCSSSLTVTSLERETGVVPEVARMVVANSSNSATGMADADLLSRKKPSLDAAVRPFNLSDNRSSLYSDAIKGKPEWSTLHSVRSTTSHDITGAISSMINQTLQFGSSELLHCQSPTSVEGPAFGGIVRLSSAEESALSTSKIDKKVSLSAYCMPSPHSSVSPPRAQKATVSKQVSKRRKTQQKRIVCVPISGDGRPSGEVLPSDMWAWRKYGQKPIKGSPYPRGYYRCSSSKGCSARKQVERSQKDPSMLILTYTSEHNHSWPAHRNSLAGTTRPRSSPEKPVSASLTEMVSHPSDALSASIMIADNSQAHAMAHFGQDPGNLGAISRSSSQEEEYFPDLEDGLLKADSCALRTDLPEDEKSEDEGDSVEVDPYNLFCW